MIQKNNYYQRIMIFLGLMLCATTNIKAQTQTIDTLIVEDVYTPGMYCSVDTLLYLPSSLYSGKIVYEYGTGITEDMQYSLLLAAHLWERYLDGDTLHIAVQCQQLSGIDVRTSVNYYTNSINGLRYPVSLARKMSILPTGFQAGADGMITFNGSSNWSSGIGTSSGKNLTYATMRSIAQIMGFTHSLKMRNSQIVLSDPNHYSIFENLIYTTVGDRLTDIPANGAYSNDALYRAMVEQEDSFVYILSDDYKLYAPPTFNVYKSLKNFFDDGSSLMSYKETPGRALYVDDATLAVLEGIGWSYRHPRNVIIACDDADSQGRMSVYEGHEFYLNEDTTTMTNHQWNIHFPSLHMPGTFQPLPEPDWSQHASYYFYIPSNYIPDVLFDNGNLNGYITYMGRKDGDLVEGRYNFTLLLTPVITSIETLSVQQRVSSSGVYYNVLLKIGIKGSEDVDVVVLGQNNVLVDDIYHNGYSIVQIRHLDLSSPAEIQVTTENNWGHASKSHIISATDTPDLGPIIRVYSSYGNYEGTIDDIEEMESSSYEPGLYLLQFTGNQTSETIKYVKK